MNDVVITTCAFLPTIMTSIVGTTREVDMFDIGVDGVVIKCHGFCDLSTACLLLC